MCQGQKSMYHGDIKMTLESAEKGRRIPSLFDRFNLITAVKFQV